MRTSAKLATGAVTAGIGVTMFMGAGAASAATPVPAPPAAADAAAAAKAATTADAQQRLGSFFVHYQQHQQGKLTNQAVTKAQAAATAPTVEGTARPVFSLNPAFVTGGGDVPVATFAYMALGAKSAAGQQASVWMTKSGASWSVMNITSGTEEAVYPARAAGGTVFTEPQIHAWYRLQNGRVTGLNDTAISSVGKGGATLAAYQRLVHTRYADKMPGSPYAQSGKLGGYSPATGVSSPAPGRGTAPVLTALGAGGAVVVAAGVLVARRRRVLG